MSNSDRLFSPASYIGLTILNVLFIFVMLSEPLGDAAESLMIKMAAPFQAKYLYDNPDNLLAYDFQTRSSEYWDKEKILLLTLDDLEVQNTGKPYPFNYAKYAEDIRMAHQLEAKAIFIDLLITDERGEDSGIEYLLNTICEINQTTPVFMASTRYSGETFDPTPMHPVLLAHSNFQTTNPVCFQEVSVALSTETGEHKYWYYPLFESNKNKRGYLPSAGLAMYNHFAKERGVEKINFDNPDTSEALMALTWGATPAQFNLDFEDTRRKQDLAPSCRKDKNAFEYLSFLPFLSYQFEEKDIPLCPYFPETRPGLLAALEGSDETGKQTALKMVKDSLVIYSVNLTGVSDIVNSPVHGTISGAHYHAMAFHNLDRFGNNYIKSAEIEFSNLYNLLDLSKPDRTATTTLLALIIALTVASHWLRGWLTYKAPQHLPWLNTNYDLLPNQMGTLKKIIWFILFLIYRFTVFVLKTIVYITLACGVVLAVSQFIVLDPFVWIEAATLVTLLFASNAIGNLFEQFIERT